MESLYYILKKHNFSGGFANEIYREDYDYYKPLLGRKCQIGGVGIIKFNYNNKIYNINYTNDEYNHIYSLGPANVDKNDPRNCFLIYIIKEDTSYAYIDNISSYNDCPHVGHMRNGRGSHLLRVVIAFIESLKDQYGLKYIQLKDNSTLECNKKGKIDLSSLYMLSQGDTWYGKYGFRPFNTYKRELDIERYIDYCVNSKLVEKIKINCTNLKLLMITAIRKNRINFSEDKIELLFKKYGDKSIKEFFKYFLSNYDTTCEIFYEIYRKFMEDIGITNLQGISYFFELDKSIKQKEIKVIKLDK